MANGKSIAVGSRADVSSSARNVAGRLNTLGLTERELVQLLDELDAKDTRPPSTKRKFVRRRFRQVQVPMHLTHPGGHTTAINVVTRNLSRSGISVLHSSYLHAGTPCSVELPTLSGTTITAAGSIARCVHVFRNVHEIGVKLDAPLDTQLMMDSGLFSDWYALEQVNPGDLAGTLLYVDDAVGDRRLIRHYLRDTNLSITTAETGEEGLERSQAGFDLIIVDFHLNSMNAGELIQQMQEAGVKAPMIVVTADTEAASTVRSIRSCAQAFLSKPIEPSLLLRAIAQYLQLGDKGTARLLFTSTLAPDHPNAPLIDSFVDDLHKLAADVTAAIEKDDFRTCWLKAAEVKGIAPAIGFDGIGQIAERAMQALTASTSVKDSTPELRKLINACRRACRAPS